MNSKNSTSRSTSESSTMKGKTMSTTYVHFVLCADGGLLIASEKMEHPAILDFVAHKRMGEIVAIQPITCTLDMCLARYDGYMYSNTSDVAILYSKDLLNHITKAVFN